MDTFPYLGVTISNKLKWSAHVSMTAAKANKSLGTIQCNLWSCPKNVNEIAHTSLVWPKLEYASAAWDLFLNKDISALERVQCKAEQLCAQNYNRYASVAGMIKDLECPMLTRRRESMLTHMYKLTYGLIDEVSGEHLNSTLWESNKGKPSIQISRAICKKNFFPQKL